MSSALDALIEQIAEAVARRVLEMQQAEAAKKRTLYLTPAEMGERMSVTVKTLANLRSNKAGPKFVKVGGSIRYPVNPD